MYLKKDTHAPQIVPLSSLHPFCVLHSLSSFLRSFRQYRFHCVFPQRKAPAFSPSTMSAFAPLSTFQVGTGLLPNEGVPFSRWMMVPPELPQQRGPAPEGTGGWSSEETQIALAQVAMLLRQLGRRTTPTATTQPAAPPPAPAATDPLAFWRCEIGYFFPEKHVDVRFLASGLRPCDDPRMWTGGFEYQVLKLPVNMAVAEMVRRVGVPGRGLQEMQELVVVSVVIFLFKKGTRRLLAFGEIHDGVVGGIAF